MEVNSRRLLVSKRRFFGPNEPKRSPSMNTFLDEEFLLTNETGRRLFHEIAEPLPVFDFYCHLSPKMIYEDKKFRSMTEAWLDSDPEKWRLMRANGVSEDFLSGGKTDWEKFEKWANIVPDLIGNPQFHWIHLELQRFFSINEWVFSGNALSVFERCNAKLTHFTARDMIHQSNLAILCTLDDPLDDLRFHELIAKDRSFSTKIYPSFQVDKALNIESPGFRTWLEKLISITHPVTTFLQLVDSLKMRIDFFHLHKCRISDQTLDEITFEDASDEEVTLILRKAIAGDALTRKEIAQYKTKLTLFLGKNYAKLDWSQQYHLNQCANANRRMMDLLGPQCGCDAMNDHPMIQPLIKMLNAMDVSDELPRTILYTSNPHDFERMLSVANCFQNGKIPGKIQVCCSWNNFQNAEIQNQIRTLGNFGLLSRFIGQGSSAQSIFSLSHHEYFRRLLCDWIGKTVEEGLFPNDEQLIRKLITDICYENAVAYFRLP